MPLQSLAQHFLVDRGIVDRIIGASDISRQDTVIEIGSGRGALTADLVKLAGRVVAIEKDSRLAYSLSSRLGNPSNLVVANADARGIHICEFLGVDEEYKVVANLPYYAANPIIRGFLESTCKPSMMVVMVQREVAVAMAAPSGQMKLISVGVQVYGAPRIVCVVSPDAFRPVPKVSSAVVRIDLFSKPAVDVDDLDGFFRLVGAGFAAPRKQIRNSLALGLGVPPVVVGRLLEKGRIEACRRPATLSLYEWECLYMAQCEAREIEN